MVYSHLKPCNTLGVARLVASLPAAAGGPAAAVGVVEVTPHQGSVYTSLTSSPFTGVARALAVPAAVVDSVDGAAATDIAAAAVTQVDRAGAADRAAAGVAAGAIPATFETALPMALRQTASTEKMKKERERRQQETHLLRRRCSAAKRPAVAGGHAVDVAPSGAAVTGALHEGWNRKRAAALPETEPAETKKTRLRRAAAGGGEALAQPATAHSQLQHPSCKQQPQQQQCVLQQGHSHATVEQQQRQGPQHSTLKSQQQQVVPHTQQHQVRPGVRQRRRVQQSELQEQGLQRIRPRGPQEPAAVKEQRQWRIKGKQPEAQAREQEQRVYRWQQSGRASTPGSQQTGVSPQQQQKQEPQQQEPLQQLHQQKELRRTRHHKQGKHPQAQPRQPAALPAPQQGRARLKQESNSKHARPSVDSSTSVERPWGAAPGAETAAAEARHQPSAEGRREPGMAEVTATVSRKKVNVDSQRGMEVLAGRRSVRTLTGEAGATGPKAPVAAPEHGLALSSCSSCSAAVSGPPNARNTKSVSPAPASSVWGENLASAAACSPAPRRCRSHTGAGSRATSNLQQVQVKKREQQGPLLQQEQQEHPAQKQEKSPASQQRRQQQQQPHLSSSRSRAEKDTAVTTRVQVPSLTRPPPRFSTETSRWPSVLQASAQYPQTAAAGPLINASTSTPALVVTATERTFSLAGAAGKAAAVPLPAGSAKRTGGTDTRCELVRTTTEANVRTVLAAAGGAAAAPTSSTDGAVAAAPIGISLTAGGTAAVGAWGRTAELTRRGNSRRQGGVQKLWRRKADDQGGSAAIKQSEAPKESTQAATAEEEDMGRTTASTWPVAGQLRGEVDHGAQTEGGAAARAGTTTEETKQAAGATASAETTKTAAKAAEGAAREPATATASREGSKAAEETSDEAVGSPKTGCHNQEDPLDCRQESNASISSSSSCCCYPDVDRGDSLMRRDTQSSVGGGWKVKGTNSCCKISSSLHLCLGGPTKASAAGSWSAAVGSSGSFGCFYCRRSSSQNSVSMFSAASAAFSAANLRNSGASPVGSRRSSIARKGEKNSSCLATLRPCASSAAAPQLTEKENKGGTNGREQEEEVAEQQQEVTEVSDEEATPEGKSEAIKAILPLKSLVVDAVARHAEGAGLAGCPAVVKSASPGWGAEAAAALVSGTKADLVAAGIEREAGSTTKGEWPAADVAGEGDSRAANAVAREAACPVGGAVAAGEEPPADAAKSGVAENRASCEGVICTNVTASAPLKEMPEYSCSSGEDRQKEPAWLAAAQEYHAHARRALPGVANAVHEHAADLPADAAGARLPQKVACGAPSSAEDTARQQIDMETHAATAAAPPGPDVAPAVHVPTAAAGLHFADGAAVPAARTKGASGASGCSEAAEGDAGRRHTIALAARNGALPPVAPTHLGVAAAAVGWNAGSADASIAGGNEDAVGVTAGRLQGGCAAVHEEQLQLEHLQQGQLRSGPGSPRERRNKSVCLAVAQEQQRLQRSQNSCALTLLQAQQQPQNRNGEALGSLLQQRLGALLPPQQLLRDITNDRDGRTGRCWKAPGNFFVPAVNGTAATPDGLPGLLQTARAMTATMLAGSNLRQLQRQHVEIRVREARLQQTQQPGKEQQQQMGGTESTWQALVQQPRELLQQREHPLQLQRVFQQRMQQLPGGTDSARPRNSSLDSATFVVSPPPGALRRYTVAATEYHPRTGGSELHHECQKLQQYLEPKLPQQPGLQQQPLLRHERQRQQERQVPHNWDRFEGQKMDECDVEQGWQLLQLLQASQQCEEDGLGVERRDELSTKLLDQRAEHVNVAQQSQQRVPQRQQTQHTESEDLGQQEVRDQPNQQQSDVHQLTEKEPQPRRLDETSANRHSSNMTQLHPRKMGTRWLRCALRYVWKLVCSMHAQRLQGKQQQRSPQDQHQQDSERLPQENRRGSTSSENMILRRSTVFGAATGDVVHTGETPSGASPAGITVERQSAAVVNAVRAVSGIRVPPAGDIIASGEGAAAATEHRTTAPTFHAANCTIPHAAAADKAAATGVLAGTDEPLPHLEDLPVARQQLLAAAAAVLPRLYAETSAGATPSACYSGNRPAEALVSEMWQRRGNEEQDTVQQIVGNSAFSTSSENRRASGNTCCDSSHRIRSSSSSYTGSAYGLPGVSCNVVVNSSSSNSRKTSSTTSGGGISKTFLNTYGSSGSSYTGSENTNSSSLVLGNIHNNLPLVGLGSKAPALSTQDAKWSSEQKSCALEDFLLRAVPLLAYAAGAAAAVPRAPSPLPALPRAIAENSAAVPLSLLQEIQRSSTNNSDSRYSSCSACSSNSSSSSSYNSSRSYSSATTYSIDGGLSSERFYTEIPERLLGSEAAPGHPRLLPDPLVQAALQLPGVQKQLLQRQQLRSFQQEVMDLKQVRPQEQTGLPREPQLAFQQNYVCDCGVQAKTQMQDRHTCGHGHEEKQCPFTCSVARTSALLAPPPPLPSNVCLNAAAHTASDKITGGAPAATTALSAAQSGAARDGAGGAPHPVTVKTTLTVPSSSASPALSATSLPSLPGADPADGGVGGPVATVRPAICRAIVAGFPPTVDGAGVRTRSTDGTTSAAVPPVPGVASADALLATASSRVSVAGDSLDAAAVPGTSARPAVRAAGSWDSCPTVDESGQDRLLALVWSLVDRVGRTVNKLSHLNASSQFLSSSRTCSNRNCYCSTDCRRQLRLQHSREPRERLQRVSTADPAADITAAAGGGRAAAAALDRHVKDTSAHTDVGTSAVTAAAVHAEKAGKTGAPEETAVAGGAAAAIVSTASLASAACKEPAAGTTATGAHARVEGVARAAAFARRADGEVCTGTLAACPALSVGDGLMQHETEGEEGSEENSTSCGRNSVKQANTETAAGDAATATADAPTGKTVGIVLRTGSKDATPTISADVSDAAGHVVATGTERNAAATENKRGVFCEAAAPNRKGRTPPGLGDVYDLFRLVPKLYRAHAPAFALLLHDSALSSLFPLHPDEVAAFASLMLQQPKPVAALLHRWMAPQCCSCCQCCTCCCRCCCCCGSVSYINPEQPAAAARGSPRRKHFDAQEVPQQQQCLPLQHLQYVMRPAQTAGREEAPQRNSQKQGGEREQHPQMPKRSSQLVELAQTDNLLVRGTCSSHQDKNCYLRPYGGSPCVEMPAVRAATELTCCTGMWRDAVTPLSEAGSTSTCTGAAATAGWTRGAAPTEVTAAGAAVHSSEELRGNVLLLRPLTAGRQQKRVAGESYCGHRVRQHHATGRLQPQATWQHEKLLSQFQPREQLQNRRQQNNFKQEEQQLPTEATRGRALPQEDGAFTLKRAGIRGEQQRRSSSSVNWPSGTVAPLQRQRRHTEGAQYNSVQQQVANAVLCRSHEERGIQRSHAAGRVMQYFITRPSQSQIPREPPREPQPQAELEYQLQAQLKRVEPHGGQQQQTAGKQEKMNQRYRHRQPPPGMDVENGVLHEQLLRQLTLPGDAIEGFQQQLLKQRQSLLYLWKQQQKGLQRIRENQPMQSFINSVAEELQRGADGTVPQREKTFSCVEAGRNTVNEEDRKSSGCLCNAPVRIPPDESSGCSSPYASQALSELCLADSGSTSAVVAAHVTAAKPFIATFQCSAKEARVAEASGRNDASRPHGTNSARDGAARLLAIVQPSALVAEKKDLSAAVAGPQKSPTSLPTILTAYSHLGAITLADAAGALPTEAPLPLTAVPPLAPTSHPGAAGTLQARSDATEQRPYATTAPYSALTAREKSTGARGTNSSAVPGKVVTLPAQGEATRSTALGPRTADTLEACGTGNNAAAGTGRTAVEGHAARGMTRSTESCCVTEAAEITSQRDADGVAALLSSSVLSASAKAGGSAFVHYRWFASFSDSAAASSGAEGRPPAFPHFLRALKQSGDGGSGADGHTPAGPECAAAAAISPTSAVACRPRSSASALSRPTATAAATFVGTEVPAGAANITVVANKPTAAYAADQKEMSTERLCDDVLLQRSGNTQELEHPFPFEKVNRESTPNCPALHGGRGAQHFEELSCVAAAGLTNSVVECSTACRCSSLPCFELPSCSCPPPAVLPSSISPTSSSASCATLNCRSLPCEACQPVSLKEGLEMDKKTGSCSKSSNSGTREERHEIIHPNVSSGNGNGNADDTCRSRSPKGIGDSYIGSGRYKSGKVHNDCSRDSDSDKCRSSTGGSYSGSTAGISKPVGEGTRCSRVADSRSGVDRSGRDCATYVKVGIDYPTSKLCAAITPDKAADPFSQQLCDMFIGTVGAPAVAVYVRRLQELSRLGAHEALMALLLLSRLMARHPYLPFCSWNAHRLLLAAFLIITKTVSDRFYNNGVWARFGGVKVTELNRLEKAFLILIDHRCFLSLEQFAAGFALLKRMRCVFPAHLAEQRRHPSAGSMLLHTYDKQRQLRSGESRLKKVSQQPLHRVGRLPRQKPQRPQRTEHVQMPPLQQDHQYTRRQQQQHSFWPTREHFHGQESRTQRGVDSFSRSVSASKTAKIDACDNSDGTGCFEGVRVCEGADFVCTPAAAEESRYTADAAFQQGGSMQQGTHHGTATQTNPVSNRGTPPERGSIESFAIGSSSRSGRRGSATGDGGGPEALRETMVVDRFQQQSRGSVRRSVTSSSSNCLRRSSVTLLKKTSAHRYDSNAATINNSDDAFGVSSSSPQRNCSSPTGTSGSKNSGSILHSRSEIDTPGKNYTTVKTHEGASSASFVSTNYQSAGCGNHGCRRCGEPVDDWSGLAEDDEPDVAEKKAANPEAYRRLLLLRRVPFSVLLQQHKEMREHRNRRKQQRAHKKGKSQKEHCMEFSSVRTNTTSEAVEAGGSGASEVRKARQEKRGDAHAGESAAAEHSASHRPSPSLQRNIGKPEGYGKKPENAKDETGSMEISEGVQVDNKYGLCQTDGSASESSLFFSESDTEDEISVNPVVEGATPDIKKKLLESDSSEGSAPGRPHVEAWLDLVGNPFANLIFCLCPALQEAVRHLEEVEQGNHPA